MDTRCPLTDTGRETAACGPHARLQCSFRMLVQSVPLRVSWITFLHLPKPWDLEMPYSLDIYWPEAVKCRSGTADRKNDVNWGKEDKINQSLMLLSQPEQHTRPAESGVASPRNWPQARLKQKIHPRCVTAMVQPGSLRSTASLECSRWLLFWERRVCGCFLSALGHLAIGITVHYHTMGF